MSKEVHHLILQDLHRVISEIGVTPSRDQYRKIGKYSWRNIQDNYGSWQGLIQAAGLWERGKVKQDKQAIRKETFEHLQKEVEDRRSTILPPKIISRLLCISDMHKPYGHPDTNSFLIALHKKYNFDHILIGGDEIDAHALSFHDHDPNLPSAGHELEMAIEQLRELYSAFPNADVLESNHGALVYRKGKHHGIPRQVLKSYNEMLQAPKGWVWRPEFIYQFSNGKKAVAHHGYSSAIINASKKRAMSLIQFHFHSSYSIQYWQNAEEQFWAIQCACLVDDTSLAMEYNKLTIERPIMGVGAVFDGHPRLLPMFLNKTGRWNGILP